MRNKGLLVLSGVTLVVFGAAIVAVRGRGATVASADAERGPLVAGLEERANDVGELFVQDAEASATLRRKGEDWVLAERSDYPADFEKVKEAVLGIARLEIEEPKTARPENHAALGVEDPEAEGSESKRVVLRTTDGEEVARLIVGDTKYRRDSQAVYVRRDGEDQVYLCDGRVTLETDAKSWIDSEILRLESDRVQDVRILHHDGEEVLIGRDPENHTQFVVLNMPPDREPQFAGVANSVGTALSYLGLDDVRPADEVDFEAEPVAITTYECTDGLVIEIETAKFEDKTWARIAARYEEVAAPIGPAAPEAGDEDATEDAAENANDSGEDNAAAEDANAAGDDVPDPAAVKAEVAELDERLGGWAFAIPDYKSEVLARRMKDLMAKLEDELPEGPVGLIDSGEAVDVDEILQAVRGEKPAGVPAPPAPETDSPADEPAKPDDAESPAEEGAGGEETRDG